MSNEEEETSEQEESTTEEAPEAAKKKFNFDEIKEKLKAIDWRDKKVMGAVGGSVMLLIIIILFSGGGAEKVEEVESAVNFEDLQRPADYVMMFGSL